VTVKMGSVDGKVLAGAPGTIMPPFWSDVWFTSRLVSSRKPLKWLTGFNVPGRVFLVPAPTAELAVE
jgi:hypothetical protein